MCIIKQLNFYREQLNEITKSSAFIRKQIEKDVDIVNLYLEEANHFSIDHCSAIWCMISAIWPYDLDSDVESNIDDLYCDLIWERRGSSLVNQ